MMPFVIRRQYALALALYGLAAASSAGQTPAAPDTTARATPPDSSYGGATPPPAAGSSGPHIDFSGVLFANYQYRTDNAPNTGAAASCPQYSAATCKDQNQFNIERVYLTFRSPLGAHASVRVTTDIFQNVTAPGNSFYAGWVLRLKYAYVQYDFLRHPAGRDGFTAFGRIGVVHTVALEQQETYWPRWLAMTALERAGFFNAADVGASAGLGLPHELGELYATITNGNGYTRPETDRFKDYALRLTLTPLARSAGFLQTLSLNGFVDAGTKASALNVAPAGQALDRERWSTYAALRDRRVTAMVEYAGQRNGNDALTPDSTGRIITTTNGHVIDGFVMVRPFEFANPKTRSPVGAFVRYDRTQPDIAADPKQQFLIAGLFWEPTRKTAFSLDYQEQKSIDGGTAAATKTFFVHVFGSW